MNDFERLANEVGIYFYYLKKTNIFTEEQALLAAIYISFANVVPPTKIDNKDIKEAFKFAKEGEFKINEYKMVPNEKPKKCNSIDQMFLINLITQIGCLYLNSFNTGDPYYSEQRILEVALRTRSKVAEIIIDSFDGIDVLVKERFPTGKTIEKEILDGLSKHYIQRDVFGFKCFPKKAFGKKGKYSIHIPGIKEYDKAMELFEKDKDEAIRLLELSSYSGYPYAKVFLGDYYFNRAESKEDIEKALKKYNQTLNTNSISSYRLSTCYKNGIIVEKDEETAKKLFYHSLAWCMLDIARGDMRAKDFLLNEFSKETSTDIPATIANDLEKNLISFREKNQLCGICGNPVQFGKQSIHLERIDDTDETLIYSTEPLIKQSADCNFGNRSFCCLDCQVEIIIPVKKMIDNQYINEDELRDLINLDSLQISIKSILFLYELIDGFNMSLNKKRNLFQEAVSCSIDDCD